MARVELRHIEKIYPGGVKAVSDANVIIEDQEFAVFVGPSGCGKSTTLRMIAGLEDISGGELYIDGRLMNEAEPKDRNISMVFQNYALYPHMTVYDNMALSLKMKKMPKDEIQRRITNAAGILGLTEYLSRKPGALSGGQRQRVAVGRAIVREPKVFLFDELLSNLDAKLRVKMRTEISRLHMQLSATMIYVTHDQVEAMTMGDKIVVMKDGFIQQIGSPLLLYDHPCNRFVAGFIGSPPMNFLDGQVVAAANGHRVEGDGFSFTVAQLHDSFIKPFAARKVTVGIRPEDMVFAAPGQTENILQAEVAVIEELGSETHLYLMRKEIDPEPTLIVKIDPHHNIHIGNKVNLTPIPEKMRYFDQHSGLALIGVIGALRMSSKRQARATRESGGKLAKPAPQR